MSLYREIGLVGSTLLVMGNIIGIGIFTTSGLIFKQLGPSPWLMGVWILGGGLAIIGAICYARLGVLFPRAGGEYAFLRPTYGPAIAFLSGWTSLVIGFTAPTAASALGLAYYLRVLLPWELAEDGIGLRIVAVGSLLLVAGLISAGLRAGTGVHSAVTILNLVLVLGFAVAVLGQSSAGQLGVALDGSLLPRDLPSMASAVVLVMFAYSGWNAAAYIAEEIKSPGRNIPLSLLLGTALVIGLYTLINAAYLAAAPLEQLGGTIAVAELTAASVFGPFGRQLVNLLILVSILSSLTAMSIAGPRVYFAMSRDRLFPRWLSAVSPLRKVPARAIWFQTLIAAGLVLVGDFYQILVYSGFVLILFATLTVSALYRVSDARVLPTVFIVVNSVVLGMAVVANPWETLAGVGTVLGGIPIYLFFRSRPADVSLEAPAEAGRVD
jgi:APA family basic amino acid/polyamine antiporter